MNTGGSSLSELTGNGDCASCFFDRRFADGETEAGSTGGARAGGISTVEAVEDVREIGWADAFTVILHGDLHGVVAQSGSNFDLGLRRAVLDGI